MNLMGACSQKGSEKYTTRLVKAVHLDFGNSLRYKNPVWDMMAARIPYSLKLCGLSMILELLIALPIGLICAVKKDSFFDRFTVNFSLLLSSIPSFWLGALAILPTRQRNDENRFCILGCSIRQKALS